VTLPSLAMNKTAEPTLPRTDPTHLEHAESTRKPRPHISSNSFRCDKLEVVMGA
jgi:hypothetical protein